MKILMLVNWKVHRVDQKPIDKQSADYLVKGKEYWFFKYFNTKPEVDIIDVAGTGIIDNIERNKLHFHVFQGLKAITKLRNYDLVISHGMTTGVIVAFWRKIFKTKCKHLVFDIGCFNSAAEDGKVMHLLQSVSKSIDEIIYHTSCQSEYYKKYYPWLTNNSKFIRFGTNPEEFSVDGITQSSDRNKYIICVGYTKRDWDTLIKAFNSIESDMGLKIVGKVCEEYKGIESVEQIPYIPINELKKQIYNAAFCVLPLKSFKYSYGQMTLLQQMALGKCVIVSNVPSFEGYIENDKTAIVYEPENVKDLSNKIRWAIEHPKEVDKIGKNAREYLINECNEEIMSKQIEQVIYTLVEQ